MELVEEWWEVSVDVWSGVCLSIEWVRGVWMSSELGEW